MPGLHDHVHRYWFEFSAPTELPLGGWSGCGVTALNRPDAEHLIRTGPFNGKPLPPIKRVVEDIDVRNLDQDHVVPNIGDVTQRGVWFPRG